MLLNWLSKLSQIKNLVVGLVVTALFFLYGLTKSKGARDKYENTLLKKNEEKRNDAAKAVDKEKRDVDGVPDGDLVDRLRRRGDDWRKL